MSTIKIYYSTSIFCLYWIIATMHIGIKINWAESIWFFIFLGIHIFFFIYWFISSYSWSLEKGKYIYDSTESYVFNPLMGTISVSSLYNMTKGNLDDNSRDELIDTNIPVSMNLLIVYNVIYTFLYTMFLFK